MALQLEMNSLQVMIKKGLSDQFLSTTLKSLLPRMKMFKQEWTHQETNK